MADSLREAAEAVISCSRHRQWNMPAGTTEVYLVPAATRDALFHALYAPDPVSEAREILKRCKATCSPARVDEINDWLERNGGTE